jgi:hypothetical protein
MKKRGQARVYRVVKNPFEGRPFTPFIGTVHSEMPTQGLWKEFKQMHTEHQEALYEKSRKQMEAKAIKDTEKLENALTPKQALEDLKLFSLARSLSILMLGRYLFPKRNGLEN